MTRPADTWRVCNQPVVVPDDPGRKGRGCACSGYELFNDKTLVAALARLAGTQDTDPASSDHRPS